jgi:hypothetical protein
VVDLRLTGRINLDRINLDLEASSRAIETGASVAAVHINPAGINLNSFAVGSIECGDFVSREEIERSAIRQLVDDDHLWGLDGQQGSVAALFYELKEAVRQRRTAEELAEIIRINPLLEKVRIARAIPEP